MHALLREVADDAKTLTLASLHRLQDRWRLVLAFAAVVALMALLVHPYDLAWYHRMTAHRTPEGRRIARLLSQWGDYHTGSFIVAGALWLAGAALRRRAWRRASVACLLAATLAGLANNTVRFTAGRPRPYAADDMGLADRFYGPRPGREFRSFPSGHSATSFGTATALAVAAPGVGAPALALAGGVVWSRLYLRDHYASDVIVGAAIGIVFGVAFGLSARRTRPPANAGGR